MNLQSRLMRLQELIMRLSQEDLSWKDDICPLHHMERNAYLSAIHKAIGALERGPDRAVTGDPSARRSEIDPTPCVSESLRLQEFQRRLFLSAGAGLALRLEATLPNFSRHVSVATTP